VKASGEPNLTAAAPAVSSGDSLTCLSFTGSVGVGAVAFSVDPSAFTVADASGDAPGAVGDADWRLQATASASIVARAATVDLGRDIKLLL
jgi:hypothetical protein